MYQLQRECDAERRRRGADQTSILNESAVQCHTLARESGYRL